MKCNYKPNKPLSKKDMENLYNASHDYLTLIKKMIDREKEDGEEIRAEIDTNYLNWLKGNSLI